MFRLPLDIDPRYVKICDRLREGLLTETNNVLEGFKRSPLTELTHTSADRCGEVT